MRSMQAVREHHSPVLELLQERIFAPELMYVLV